MRRDSFLVDVGVVGFLLLLVALHLAGCGSVEMADVDAGGGAGGRGGAGGADVGGRGGAELGGRGGDVGQGGAAAGTTGSAGTGGASCTPAAPTDFYTCSGPTTCPCNIGQTCPSDVCVCQPDRTRTCSCGGTCGPCPSAMSVGGQGCPENRTTNPGANRRFGCVWNGAIYLGCAVGVHGVTGRTVFISCDADCS